MSTQSAMLDRLRRSAWPADLGPMRALSLLATLALIASFASVFYGLVDVAGEPTHFTVALLGSLAVGTVLARTVGIRFVILLATTLLVIGLAWYLYSLSRPPEPFALLASNLELLSGQSLHQIRESGTWAIAVTPAPVLISWYLALRRRYALAAVVGGITLGYLVLTGDATTLVTVLGMVGAAGMLGYGDLDQRAGTLAGAEHVAVVLAIMVVVPFAVSVVPGAVGTPLSIDREGPTTLETNLLTDQRELAVSGDVSLSPDVRFTIESPRGRYWKTNSFDRYTGSGWVRTGGTVPLSEASLTFPEGPRQTIRQTVEVESPLSSLPAAWRPIEVDPAIADQTAVTQAGDLVATEPLAVGESYQVVSAVAVDPRDRYAETDQAYPPGLYDRYTRLPESTTDRVRQRTAEITAGTEGTFQTVTAIETWLEANRGYSLDVEETDGSIADAFLFEMDEGYCTYFATTMVVMLRSEGIPARLATGYTTGQQVAPNRWVVRGLDAHAWVEVYVQGRGWVTVDPTPSDPREEREDSRIVEARQNNETSVDTNESVGQPPSPPETVGQEAGPVRPEPTFNSTPLPENIQGSLSEPNESSTTTADEPGLLPVDVPPREQLALGLVVLFGAIAGLRRSGATRWLGRTRRVVWQRRIDPETDVARAFERMTILLERRHRSRRPGETVRDYLAAIDAPESAWRLAEIRERVRYAGEVDEALADEAVSLADELRGNRQPANPTARAPDW